MTAAKAGGQPAAVIPPGDLQGAHDSSAGFQSTGSAAPQLPATALAEVARIIGPPYRDTLANGSPATTAA